MSPELAKYAAALVPTITTPIMLKLGVPTDVCMELIGVWVLALGGHVTRDLMKTHHEAAKKKP